MQGCSPLRFEEIREERFRALKIWLPDPNDAEWTVVLRYRVANALRCVDRVPGEPPHVELYWNVAGREFSAAPIESATAHVILPPGVTGVRAAVSTGAADSSESAATVHVEGSDVIVSTTRPLGRWEGLTVVVRWQQ